MERQVTNASLSSPKTHHNTTTLRSPTSAFGTRQSHALMLLSNSLFPNLDFSTHSLPSSQQRPARSSNPPLSLPLVLVPPRPVFVPTKTRLPELHCSTTQPISKPPDLISQTAVSSQFFNGSYGVRAACPLSRAGDARS